MIFYYIYHRNWIAALSACNEANISVSEIVNAFHYDVLSREGVCGTQLSLCARGQILS
jgi:hypothetical protein